MIQVELVVHKIKSTKYYEIGEPQAFIFLKFTSYTVNQAAKYIHTYMATLSLRWDYPS